MMENDENNLKSSIRLTTLSKKLKTPLLSDCEVDLPAPKKAEMLDSSVNLNRKSSVKHGLSMWKALLEKRKSTTPPRKPEMPSKSHRLSVPAVIRAPLSSLGWSSSSLSISSNSGMSHSRSELSLPLKKLYFMGNLFDQTSIFFVLELFFETRRAAVR